MANLNGHSLLIVKPNSPGRGLVVYKSGYYFGQIHNCKAEDDQATMVIIEEIKERGEAERVSLILRGKWKEGYFIEGKAFDSANRELF
jgi:hypothetical protein